MPDSQPVSEKPLKSVLFVCVGNSCRSQMAEAFAREYGADVVNAASAGLSSTSRIAADTIEVMREKGISLAAQFPKDFEPGLAKRYDLIVNISGFDLPRVSESHVVEWDIADPYGEPLELHRGVRDQIERKVRALLSDLREYGMVRPDEPSVAAAERKPGLWRRLIGRG